MSAPVLDRVKRRTFALTSRASGAGGSMWRTDLRRSIPHPHVVVQDDVFNHSRITSVVVCALTSNLSRANEAGNVLLEVGEGNLSKRSVVVVSQVSSVDKGALGERIGSHALRLQRELSVAVCPR